MSRLVGVPVSSQLLGTGSGQDSLTVVVGQWSDVRGELAAGLIARGPGGDRDAYHAAYGAC